MKKGNILNIVLRVLAFGGFLCRDLYKEKLRCIYFSSPVLLFMREREREREREKRKE
jgi:hypothetical protein